MRAAAHTKGGFGGVPQKVGEDFDEADKREGTRYSKNLPAKKTTYRKKD